MKAPGSGVAMGGTCGSGAEGGSDGESGGWLGIGDGLDDIGDGEGEDPEKVSQQKIGIIGGMRPPGFGTGCGAKLEERRGTGGGRSGQTGEPDRRSEVNSG